MSPGGEGNIFLERPVKKRGINAYEKKSRKEWWGRLRDWVKRAGGVFKG